MHRHDGEVTEVSGLLRRVGVGGLAKEKRVSTKEERGKGEKAHLSIRLKLVPHLPEVLGEERLRNGLSVDANSLTNGDEMRRSVQSNLRLRRDRGEKGGDESAGRSLALGTGDVEDVEAVQVVRLFQDEEKKERRSARLALTKVGFTH